MEGGVDLYNFTKNDFLILRVILKRGATSEMISISIKTIEQDTKLSSVKIRGTLKLFIEEGYLKYGLRKVNAKTVYITTEGINKYNEVMGGN